MSKIIAKIPQTDRSNNDAEANKDSFIILGGSMIKNVNGRNISRSHTVKVCPNPGASTHDLMETCHAEKAKRPGNPNRYERHSTGDEYNEDG